MKRNIVELNETLLKGEKKFCMDLDIFTVIFSLIKITLHESDYDLIYSLY
jgi:hypothetical protein